MTGATGFLGTRVVRQLLGRGHTVRVIARSTARALPDDWRNCVEVIHADLLISNELRSLFDGVDVLIHLAAAMHGTADAQRAAATIGTERILDAMSMSGSTRHLVLASSCSVYDWTTSCGILNEKSPLETTLSDRDGYSVAKIMQEHISRRFADENRWTLSILRPGFIYGPGAHPAGGAGLRFGGVFLVIAPFARLRLTHVENCASAFVNAAEKRIEGAFNIIDDDQVSAWRYTERLINCKSGHLRIPIPYYGGLAIAYIGKMVGHVLPPSAYKKLPGIFKPRQYRARFKPLQYDNSHAKESLGWKCQSFFDNSCDVI